MITVYTTPTCATCRNVKMFFDRHEIAYETKDISDEPEIQQNLYETTGTLTVPITTDGEKYVVGADYAKLRELSA